MKFEALARRQPFALVHTGKESLIVLTTDQTISREIYIRGEFEFTTFNKVLSLLQLAQVDHLVDVGANIGTICIPALINGTVRHAWVVEPEPLNYRVLQANLALNGLADRVRQFNVACATEDGTLSFEISPNNSGDHRIRMSNTDGSFGEASRQVISVPSRRLDDLLPCDELSNLLIWVDVQGFEGYVLGGAARLLESAPPLVFEFWPYGLERTQSYGFLRSAVSHYEWFYDLSVPQPKPQPFTTTALDALYASLHAAQKHTDLLLVSALSISSAARHTATAP